MIFFISASMSLVRTPPPSFSRRAVCWVFNCWVLRLSAVIHHAITLNLQRSLPGGDLVNGNFVEHTVDTGVDKRSHDLGGHTDGCQRSFPSAHEMDIRRVLGLLEELRKTGSTVKQVTGRGIATSGQL
jgi:hypothetical protein